VIKVLYENGVNVDWQDVNGWTGLTWASWNANESAIELMLMVLGADPSPVAKDGRTPLMFLSSMGISFGVHLLLMGRVRHWLSILRPLASLSLAAGWPAAHFAPDGSTLASAGARAGWAST
jgi:hypothetical protein